MTCGKKRGHLSGPQDESLSLTSVCEYMESVRITIAHRKSSVILLKHRRWRGSLCPAELATVVQAVVLVRASEPLVD